MIDDSSSPLGTWINTPKQRNKKQKARAAVSRWLTRLYVNAKTLSQYRLTQELLQDKYDIAAQISVA